MKSMEKEQTGDPRERERPEGLCRPSLGAAALRNPAAAFQAN